MPELHLLDLFGPLLDLCLSCNGEHRTGHRTPDAASLCSAELPPPAGNALANAAERAVVFSHKAALLAQFNLVSTRIGSFSVKLLSTLSASSVYSSLISSQVQDCALPFLELHISLFSSQCQSLWKAAQPSDIICQSSQFCTICKLSEDFLCPNNQVIRW